MNVTFTDVRARITEHEEIITNGPVRSVVPPGYVVLMLPGHDRNFVLDREVFERAAPDAKLNVDTAMYDDSLASPYGGRDDDGIPAEFKDEAYVDDLNAKLGAHAGNRADGQQVADQEQDPANTGLGEPDDDKRADGDTQGSHEPQVGGDAKEPIGSGEMAERSIGGETPYEERTQDGGTGGGPSGGKHATVAAPEPGSPMGNDPDDPKAQADPSEGDSGGVLAPSQPGTPVQTPHPPANAADGTAEAAPDNLDDRTVEELKDTLRERGLPVSGNKDELIDRLRKGK